MLLLDYQINGVKLKSDIFIDETRDKSMSSILLIYIVTQPTLAANSSRVLFTRENIALQT